MVVNIQWQELKTICECGSKAIYNVRKINGKLTFSGDQVAIDGKDKITYDSLCAKCYYEKLKKFKSIKGYLK